jgi:transcriptional regulator with XRE-family HTH domain
MSAQGGKTKIQNRLWSARKRRGLGQKQIAVLMGKTIEEVSRYERGVRLPELLTLLSIEIAYGAPLRVLFKELYEQTLQNVRQRIEGRAGAGSVFADLLTETEKAAGDYCAYEELLKTAATSALERGRVRDHVTHLAKKLAGL